MASQATPIPGQASLIQDPQFQAYIESIINAHVSETTRRTEQRYAEETRAREESIKAWYQEAEAKEARLKAEISRLTAQLAEVSANDVHNSESRSILRDSADEAMLPPPTQQESRGSAPSIPSSPPSVHIPPRNTEETPSTPARNLRSSSRRGSAIPPPVSPPGPTTPKRSSTMKTSTRKTPIKPSPQGRTASPKAQTPTRSRKDKVVVKGAAEIYRVLDSEIPGDAKPLKKAIELHIRILWKLQDAQDVPNVPSDETLADFASRFSSLKEIYALGGKTNRKHPSLVDMRSSLPVVSNSRTATGIQRVEQHILEFIDSRLATFGLEVFAPDFRQTPYCLYNHTCRYVALDTFKQALMSLAYAHLGAGPSHATNEHLLIKLYDHFVHHVMYQRFRKETRAPGSTKSTANDMTSYRARARLATYRLNFLIENGYPKRYQRLISAKSTSDDEADTTGYRVPGSYLPVYWIKRRPERSVAAETFIRLLDEKRREVALMNRGHSRERLRLVPSNQQDSKFRLLPQNMPIDYYDPTFYNQLQPRLRSALALPLVALLPDVSKSFMRTADEKLSDEAFMAKFGDDVLKKYDFVDPGDLGDVEDGPGGDDMFVDEDEDEEFADEEWDESMEDVNSHRDDLARLLSSQYK